MQNAIRFREMARSLGVFLGVAVVSSVSFVLIGELLPGGAEFIFAIVVGIASVIGLRKPLAFGWLKYRSSYVALLLMLPLVFTDEHSGEKITVAPTPTPTPPAASVATKPKEETRISNETQRALWMIRGESTIKLMLKDPDSAQFRNLYVSEKVAPVVCGEVNSKNGFGGYTGFTRVITGNRADLTFFETDVPPGEFHKIWHKLC